MILATMILHHDNSSKISNVYLACKFALLDHSHSKSEIKEILQNNKILVRELNICDFDEKSLEKAINFYSENGSRSESSKILLELLRKKYTGNKSHFIPTLKTLDTILWVGGLEQHKNDEIEDIIRLYEDVENCEFTEKVLERIIKCIHGYEDYDIDKYLSINF